MNAAFGHVDASSASQEKEAVFDNAKALRIGQLLVAIVGNAVELHEPVGEAFTRFDLAGTEFPGLFVPRQDSLGASTACGRPDAQYLLQGLFVVIAVEDA